MVGGEGGGDAASAGNGHLAALDVEAVVAALAKTGVDLAKTGGGRGERRSTAAWAVVGQELAGEDNLITLGGLHGRRWQSGADWAERQVVVAVGSWRSGRVESCGSVLSWALGSWGPKLRGRHVACEELVGNKLAG